MLFPLLAGPSCPPGAADQPDHQADRDGEDDQTDGDLREAQGRQAGSLWGSYRSEVRRDIARLCSPLVEGCIVMLRQFCYEIKNQLKAPKVFLAFR